MAIGMISYTTYLKDTGASSQSVYIFNPDRMTTDEAVAHIKSGEYSPNGFSVKREHYDIIKDVFTQDPFAEGSGEPL